MKRPQDIATPERHKHDLPRPSRAGQRPRAFLRDEDGSLIVFSLMVFVLMLTISGLAVDIMRFETNADKTAKHRGPRGSCLCVIDPDTGALRGRGTTISPRRGWIRF